MLSMRLNKKARKTEEDLKGRREIICTYDFLCVHDKIDCGNLRGIILGDLGCAGESNRTMPVKLKGFIFEKLYKNYIVIR